MKPMPTITIVWSIDNVLGTASGLTPPLCACVLLSMAVPSPPAPPTGGGDREIVGGGVGGGNRGGGGEGGGGATARGTTTSGVTTTVGLAAETRAPSTDEIVSTGEDTSVLAADWTAASVAAGVVAGVAAGVAVNGAVGMVRMAPTPMLADVSRSVRKQLGSSQLSEWLREAERDACSASLKDARSPVRVRLMDTTVAST